MQTSAGLNFATTMRNAIRCAGGSIAILVLLGHSTVGNAQGRSMSSSKGAVELDPYRAFSLSLPLVTITRDAMARAEFNLMGEGALAVEVGRMSRGQQYSEKHTEETGESLENEAMQGSILISRYTNGNSMSGFYWSLGAGYRRTTATWQKLQAATAADDFALGRTFGLVDDSGRVTHAVVGEGITGHGRLGFRWIGTSFPMVLGGYVGVRHYGARYRDDDKRIGEDPRFTAITDDERKDLRRRFMTQLDPGIELGFAF